ncbi:hypothetical protein [Desulfitobacterium chlororespirans]|nr:hypothetical protein [Desulfitobacterium chlororespirans]
MKKILTIACVILVCFIVLIFDLNAKRLILENLQNLAKKKYRQQ